MRSDFYVYCWTNLINGKQYVGKGRGSRHKAHKYPSRTASVLSAALKKYGPDNFSVAFLGTDLEEKDAFALEIESIARLGTMVPLGYNRTLGGEGPTGFKASPETRQLHAKASAKMWETRDRAAPRALQIARYAKIAAREAQAKVTAIMVAEIRFLYALGAGTRRIATRYGITQSHTDAICKRKRWDIVLPLLSPEAQERLKLLACELIEESRKLRSAAGMKGHAVRWGVPP